MRYLLSMAIVGLFSITYGQQINYIENWQQASETAKVENKNILIVLTASEWCRPCIKMKRKVFENKEFTDYVYENLVVFLIELRSGEKTKSSRAKAHISYNDSVYQMYRKLAAKYNAHRLPSLILVDSKGSKIRNIKGSTSSVKNVLAELRK